MIKQIEKNDCGQTTVRYILSKFSKCNYYASYPLKRKCDNVFQIKEELSDNGLLYDCYELNNDKLNLLKPNSIVRIEKENTGHFLVLIEKKKNKYKLYDPIGKIYWIKRNEIDFKVTSALFFKSGKVKKIQPLSTLKTMEYIKLALISILECIAIILSLFFASIGNGLFTLISVIIFLLLLSVLLLNTYSLSKKLDDKFVLKYLSKHLNTLDYKYVLKVKEKIIVNPLLVYGSITCFGVVIYVLLSSGIQYLLATTFVILADLLVTIILKRKLKIIYDKIEYNEDNFLKSIKRKSIAIKEYKDAQKYSYKFSLYKSINYIVDVLLSLIFSSVILVLEERLKIEHLIQVTCFIYFLFLFIKSIFSRLKNVDLYCQELSKLHKDAYEIFAK